MARIIERGRTMNSTAQHRLRRIRRLPDGRRLRTVVRSKQGIAQPFREVFSAVASGFVTGLGQLVSLGFHPAQLMPSETEAMRSDWVKLGRDFDRAIQIVRERERTEA